MVAGPKRQSRSLDFAERWRKRAGIRAGSIDPGPQLLAIRGVLLGDAHAFAFVEPGGSSRVLRIDAKGDAPYAPFVKIAEGMAQKRGAKPAAAPRRPHREGIDP